MSKTTRREAMQALGAMAAGKWAAEGYDPEDLDGWDPPADGATYQNDKWRFSPDVGVSASVTGVMGDMMLESQQVEEATVHVHYDSRSVNVDIEGSGDGLTRGGALAMLSPEEAREVAAAIYMAAEELDQRGSG